ncbi:MAG: YegP family protein [Ignavibacteriae bacterium]|nr:YegP family protein [Ignavibacteriota bacterium]
MGRFLISKRSNNEFQFVLEADNNQVILVSEGYTTKAACYDGIDSVKVNTPYDNRYNRLSASDGRYYFTLTAQNNKVIGTSQMYQTMQSREVGIASVKANAPTAEIIDLTN